MISEKDAEEPHGVFHRFKGLVGGVGSHEDAHGARRETYGSRTFTATAKVNGKGRPFGMGIHVGEIGRPACELEDFHLKANELLEGGRGRRVFKAGEEFLEEGEPGC